MTAPSSPGRHQWLRRVGAESEEEPVGLILGQITAGAPLRLGGSGEGPTRYRRLRGAALEDIRQAARMSDLSVSVIRTNDLVVVEDRDYEVSADEDLAIAIDARLTRRTLSFDDTLQERRRARIRVVSPSADPEVSYSERSTTVLVADPSRQVAEREVQPPLCQQRRAFPGVPPGLTGALSASDASGNTPQR